MHSFAEDLPHPFNIRAERASTRRRLHEKRPATPPEIRDRVGRWKGTIEAARLAGRISARADLYLQRLLTMASVARGQWCLYSDARMAERLNCSSRTVRRHRAEAKAAGLIEVLGDGTDRKPCMVRPLLADGAVFLAGFSDTSGRLTRPMVAADLLSTETVKTERAPLTPQAVPQTQQGGSDDENLKDAISFAEFWLASGKGGSSTYAELEWRKLTGVDRVAISDVVRAGRLHTGSDIVGLWLKFRRWGALAALPTQVWIAEGSSEWVAWQAHLRTTQGKGTPIDGKGGWRFPSRRPPYFL